ncbi:MAG: caspase family protein [Candidatus Obscuribacter phosphatis]|uniref:Caspase family protein n=1 Tax=Candidatus Obscuribacter phosphatis TaxID=1906157 RepID=A0A8J7P8X4_9BACT|nr:caspase family protein [Candidatus Obscuribacter phosphatis]
MVNERIKKHEKRVTQGRTQGLAAFAGGLSKNSIAAFLSLSCLLSSSLFGVLPQPALAAWYDNENTLHERGKQSYNSGAFDQAISQFSEVIKLNPTRAGAFYWRAMAYQAIKQQDRALKDLDEAIKLAPDCATCYLSRGLIYSNQGKLQEALEQFEEALRYDSNLNEAEINKKFCLKELEKQRIAKENAASKPEATQLAMTTTAATSSTSSTSSSANPVKKAGTSTAASAAQVNDPKWIALQKELEVKAQRERAEAEKLALARAKAEAENQRLALKQKEIEERQERERARLAEAEARRLALAEKSGHAATGKPKAETAETTETTNSLEIVNRPVRDKWALIIGISNFQDSTLNLRYPAKDAKDFYEFLVKEANFAPDHVKLLTDEKATRANILSELGDKWLPRVANPDDLVLIYFSSHGSASDMDIGGVNYLLAYDSQVDSLYASGLPMQDLTRIIKGRVHSDRVVLVLDACHSGAAETGGKGLFRKGNLDADAVAQGTGQLVISSSQPSQVSWESKKYQNSVFTRCLIDSLRKNGDATTLGEAFQNLKDKVQEEVLRERGVMQTPVLKSRWKGSDLRLATPAVSPRPGLETP